MTARTTLRRLVQVQMTYCPAGQAAYDGLCKPVSLIYRVSDPFAVSLDIPDGGVVVTWLLSRELLADGLDTASGLGDVEVHPDLFDDAVVWVCLFHTDGSGFVLLGFARADLERFLDDTDLMVPAGTEAGRINWTRELALLAGDR